MALVRLAFFPDGTAAHYAALAEEIGPEAVAPPERLLFATGPVPGGWQVVQAWTSEEALEAFNAAVLAPATQRLGGRGFPELPHVVDFETTDLSLATTVQEGTVALPGEGETGSG